MSLSKNQIKLINCLNQKKQRNKHQLFVAEGIKVVKELLKSSLKLETLFVTNTVSNLFKHSPFQTITENDLKKVSLLKTPNHALALFKIPLPKAIKTEGLTVALDDINDPGNLGTIIRLCDWFGIQQLICSKNTVDCYNSKVVQASMGSLTRVQINYVNLKDFLQTVELPKYTANIKGENVYKTCLPKRALLIMGNEANGIRPEIQKLSSHQVTIPKFKKSETAESLNVATATAILLSEFNRST